MILTTRFKHEVKEQSPQRSEYDKTQRENIVDVSQQTMRKNKRAQVDYNDKTITKPTSLGKNSMEILKKQAHLKHREMSKEAWNEKGQRSGCDRSGRMILREESDGVAVLITIRKIF